MIINQFFEVRDQVERLRLDLTELLKKEQPAYRSRLKEEVDLLKESLDKSKVPELFRIAIVGTFKTGKSSFVNRLAEERLAGVETNPETAAISVFRYAETPRAEVDLISHEEWQRMEDLYEDAPKHPEAYRVAGLGCSQRSIQSYLASPWSTVQAERQRLAQPKPNYTAAFAAAICYLWIPPSTKKSDKDEPPKIADAP